MANEYSDEDIQKYIGGAAAAYAPPAPVAAIQEKPKGSFVPTLKRTIGQNISALGTTVEDIAGEGAISKAASGYGAQLQRENPASIQKLSDIADHPGALIPEAVGNAVAQMPSQIAGNIIGRAIGGVGGGILAGPPGAVIGQELVGRLGGALPTLISEYGGIRQQQKEAGIEDKTRALTAAIPATIIEFATGPQKILANMLAKGGKAITEETAKEIMGMSTKEIAKYVGKKALKTGAEEGVEEVLQNPIEAWGAKQDPFSPEQNEQTALGGVLGAIGGAFLGGGMHGSSAVRAQFKDLTKPAAEQEAPQKELAPGEQGSMFGETPPPAPRSMIDEDMYTKLRGLGADHDTALFATRRDEYGIKMREAFEAGQTPELKYRSDMEKALVKAGADIETATLAALPTEETRQTYNYLRSIGLARTDAIKQSLVVEPVMADSQESLFAPEGKGKFSYTGETESVIKPKKAGAAAVLGKAQPFDYGINLFTPGYGGQTMAKEMPATTQAEAAPKPGSREDLARTLDDHLAGGRITQQDHELLIGDVNNPEAQPKLIKKAMARAITATAKEAKNAVQIGKPKKILPREQSQVGEAGRVGEGVGQVQQGTQVAAEGKAQKVAAPSPVYNEAGEIVSGGRTQEELKAQFNGAAARLMGKLTRNTRANIVPEEDVNVMRELVAMFDAAIGLGHISLKQAVKYVLDSLGLGEGDLSSDLLKQAHTIASKQRGVKAARGVKGAGEALGKTLDETPETLKPVVMDFMGWDENGDIDPEVDPMTFRAIAAKYGEVSHESWKKRLAAAGFTEADRQAQIDAQTTEQATEEVAPDQRVEEGTEEVQGAFTPTGELIKDDEVVERDPTDVGVKKQAISTDTGLRWKTDIKKAITKWKEPHLAQASAEFMEQGEKSGVSPALFAEINKEMGRREAVRLDVAELKIAETSRAEKAAAAQALKDKESAENQEKHAQETVKQLPKQQVQTAGRMWTLMTGKPFGDLTAVQQIAYTRGVEAVTSDSQVATEQDFGQFLTNMHNAFLRTNKMEVLHADQSTEAAGAQAVAKNEGAVKSTEDQEAVRGSARQVRPVNVEVKKKKVLGPKLSETTGAKNPISAESLTSRLKALFRAAPLFDKIIKIYATQAEAMKNLAGGKFSVIDINARLEAAEDAEDAALVKEMRNYEDIQQAKEIVDWFERNRVLAVNAKRVLDADGFRLTGIAGQQDDATRALRKIDAAWGVLAGYVDAGIATNLRHATSELTGAREALAGYISAATDAAAQLNRRSKFEREIRLEVENAIDTTVRFSESGRIQGFKTTDGKIGLIAENIEDGQELGVFLHEVGVHLGMEKLIGKANMAWLDTRVRAWAKKNDGSPESVAAKAAIARSEKSTTDDNAEGRIAYMVEELVKQGVQPRAATKGTLAEWLSKFINWTRIALIKMGLDAKTSFSGQNLVDLAYGAASMELTGKQGATRTYQNREAFESAEKYVKDDYETLATATLPNGQVSATRIPRGVKLSEVAPRKAAELIAGAAGSSAVTDAAHYLKVAMTSLEMLHDTVTRVAKTLPSVTDWYKGIMDMKATRTEIKRRADVIAGMASSLSRESYAKTNKFIERATTEQKWYRQPEWLSRKVVVDSGMAAEWKKLTSEEQAIADVVFKFGEDESNNMQKQFKALGVSDVFTQIGKLEGPYAPLMRFGGFVGVLKSQTLLDAEKDAKTGSAAAIARVEALKRDAKHFVSKKFYTLGQATAFTTANKSKYAYAVPFTESERLDDKSSMGYQQLQKIMAAVDASTESMPAGAKESMHKLVKDIYMTTVDQTSARQSGQKRQGIAGADENMLSAFAIHARAHAAFVASIEHGPEVNKAFYAMQQEAKENKYAGQDDFNLLARHYAEMTHYNPSPIQDAVMAGTTVFMLSTSLSYHIQNFSQTAVKSVPKLAADFNDYTGAWKHIFAGYRLMGSITEYGKNPDLSKIKDEGLRAALTYAAEHELLDVGLEEDLSHLGRFQTGYALIDGSSALVSKVLHKLRQISRTVESWNRISSGTAAYNMAIANGRTHDQAQSYVMDMLNTTQGDTSRTDAPLLLKKMPKVMAQYKRFQFLSAAMYTKAAYAAFEGATAEERGIGRRMLGFTLLHTSVAGGVLALPLMNLASLAFGMMGGDDDPEDMDTVIRRHLGEGIVSDFLLDGAPKALLGIDMSAKLSDRNLFSIAPYTTFDFSSKAGVIGTVAGVAGGPSLSQAGRMADGIGLMKRGEMYKGVEKMVPKGFESAMQSFRMANEGVTLKNGDVIIKPEDLSTYALALTAVGMPSAQMREITRNQNVQYMVRKFYDDRTKDLTQKFVAAARDKDAAEMAALKEDWHAMQLSKDKVRYLFNDVPQELKKQPVHNLTRAVLTARKRQRLEQKVAVQ